MISLIFLYVLSNPMQEVTFKGEVFYKNFVFIHGLDYTGDFRKDSSDFKKFRFLTCAGGVSFKTWSNYEKSVSVRVHSAEPKVDSKADIVIVCGTIEVNRPVYISFFAEATDKFLDVAPGKYVLRWSQFKVDEVDLQAEEGRDHYVLDLWPTDGDQVKEIIVAQKPVRNGNWGS
jgi:hypothetical protein